MRFLALEPDGTSGYSGYSGISGYSGYSGRSGFSGYSGESGYSGAVGTGVNGESGYSGYSGRSGYSGYSGLGVSGYSGYSGALATEADLPIGLGFLGKHYAESVSQLSGTSRINVGGMSPATNGTVTNATDTVATWLKVAATAGDVAYINSSLFRTDHRFRAAIVLKTPVNSGSEFTDIRIVAGLWDQSNVTSVFNGQHMGSTQGCAFIYDTSIPDTTWRCHTCDATGSPDYTETNSGVTVSADTYYRLVIDATSSQVRFYIQTGLSGTLSLVATHTTHLPTSTLTMTIAVAAADPNVTASRYFLWSKFSTLTG